MSLFKKTIVLGKESAVGYATIVKIGNSVGVKVNINEPFSSLGFALKLGQNELFEDLSEQKSEFNYTLDYSENEILCAYLLNGTEIYAHGGKKCPSLLENALLHFNKTTEILEEQDEQNEQNSPNEPEPNETKEVPLDFLNKQTDKNFYISVANKLDELMTVYPRDTVLESLLPDSQFVKILYDETEHYSVGTLTDDGKVSNIVYAIQGKRDILPPKETADVSQFIPLEESSDSGYWLIIQSADTGETLKND